jgi:hypothetical protein
MSSRNRELSQLYDTAWTEVKQAVDKADPEGLLAMGAPSDEYDDAVSRLVRKVLKGEAITAADLAEWFTDNYGIDTADSAVEALVDELTSIQTRLLHIG